MKPHEDREAAADFRRSQRDAKTEKSHRDDAIKALMQHGNGRSYVWWLLEITGMHNNPFTSNALNTSFNCGQQNIGQQVLAHIMEVCPDQYVQMLKEKNDAANMVNAQRNSQST